MYQSECQNLPGYLKFNRWAVFHTRFAHFQVGFQIFRVLLYSPFEKMKVVIFSQNFKFAKCHFTPPPPRNKNCHFQVGFSNLQSLPSPPKKWSFSVRTSELQSFTLHTPNQKKETMKSGYFQSGFQAQGHLKVATKVTHVTQWHICTWNKFFL